MAWYGPVGPFDISWYGPGSSGWRFSHFYSVLSCYGLVWTGRSFLLLFLYYPFMAWYGAIEQLPFHPVICCYGGVWSGAAFSPQFLRCPVPAWAGCVPTSVPPSSGRAGCVPTSVPPSSGGAGCVPTFVPPSSGGAGCVPTSFLPHSGSTSLDYMLFSPFMAWCGPIQPSRFSSHNVLL